MFECVDIFSYICSCVHANVVNCQDKTSSRHGVEISAEKTKLMTNSTKPIEKKITVSGQELNTVNQFKYLGAVLSEEGPKISHSQRGADSSSTDKAETHVERQKHHLGGGGK